MQALAVALREDPATTLPVVRMHGGGDEVSNTVLPWRIRRVAGTHCGGDDITKEVTPAGAEGRSGDWREIVAVVIM